SDLEAPALPAPDDAAGGGVVKVRTEHADARVGVALAEGATSLLGLLDVAVEVAAPARLGDLHRAVHEVAGDDRLGFAAAQAHADVAGRVARCGLQPDRIGQLVIHLDQLLESGIE